MQWVNADDREPVYFGKYFVLIDGRKDIIEKFEFSKRKEFSTTLLWLEDDEYIAKAQKTKKQFYG